MIRRHKPIVIISGGTSHTVSQIMNIFLEENKNTLVYPEIKDKDKEYVDQDLKVEPEIADRKKINEKPYFKQFSGKKNRWACG